MDCPTLKRASGWRGWAGELRGGTIHLKMSRGAKRSHSRSSGAQRSQNKNLTPGNPAKKTNSNVGENLRARKVSFALKTKKSQRDVAGCINSIFFFALSSPSFSPFHSHFSSSTAFSLPFFLFLSLLRSYSMGFCCCLSHLFWRG